MILLRRLNNAVIGLNADLIERLDATPDTVITLVDGKKFVVAETPEEVVERIVAFRANVLLKVGPQGSFGTPPVSRPADSGSPQLRLVTDTRAGESDPADDGATVDDNQVDYESGSAGADANIRKDS